MSCNPVEEEIRLLSYTLTHMKKDHPDYEMLKNKLIQQLKLVYGESV